MRSAIRIGLVATMAVGFVALAAAPGGAGGTVTNTVTILKQVVGTPPAGAVFSVSVDCQSILGPGSQAVVPVVSFDAAGQPTSNNTFTVPAGTKCTITETETAGASTVGYSCDITRGNTDQIGPPFLGNCTGDNEVTFTDVIGDAATITVTNTFVAPPAPPPTPPAVQAVQAAPTFTG